MRDLFQIFMFICGIFIIINSILTIKNNKIDFRELTLNNFNNNLDKGIIGVVNLILSILVLAFFYYIY